MPNLLRKLSITLLLGTTCAVSDIGTALACSRIGPPTEALTRQQVEQSVRNSHVLVEAIVEEGADHGGATALRTVRLWRGPREPVFRLTMLHSCNGYFTGRDVGRRVRVALWRTDNGLYTMILPRDPPRYQRLLDRALRRMPYYEP